MKHCYHCGKLVPLTAEKVPDIFPELVRAGIKVHVTCYASFMKFHDKVIPAFK